MTRRFFLFGLLCLFQQMAFCDTRTSSQTVYVGSKFTVNPVTLSGLSTSKAMAGSAKFPEGPFAVAQTYHTVQIAGSSSSGLKGGYYTYEVTALQAGTFTITGGATVCTKVDWAISFGGGTNYWAKETQYNSFTLTVTVKPVPVVTQIIIPSSYTTNIGATYQFSPQIIESGASTSLSWYSSNTSVATIDNNGQMSAIGVGTTTITCTAHNGVSAHCEVTVNPILATSIALNVEDVELSTTEKVQLSATVLPANTTTPNVTWSTSNSNIATVDGSGLITAIAPGICDIVATTTDGSNLTASCRVNVLSDVLYTDIAVGVPSGTLVLPIQLKNTSAITGLQFELQLPDGVTVATNGDKLQATLSDRAADQSISGSKLANGNYQFVVFSGTSSALTGNEGAIAYITLDIDESMATGEYEISIKEVELTKTDGTSLHHKDLTSKLILTEALVGDINGDGKITVTDAVGIVNHVLHRTPSVFITKAADVNGDGNITISDAVKVVNIVLNK